jgi:hypothetical protein
MKRPSSCFIFAQDYDIETHSLRPMNYWSFSRYNIKYSHYRHVCDYSLTKIVLSKYGCMFKVYLPDIFHFFISSHLLDMAIIPKFEQNFHGHCVFLFNILQ